MDRGGFLTSEERAYLEARVLYLDADTIRGWRDRTRREGVRALLVFGWKGGQSRLTPAQEAELAATLDRSRRGR